MTTTKTKTPDSAARQPRMNARKCGAFGADVSSAKVYVRALVKALDRIEAAPLSAPPATARGAAKDDDRSR